MSDKSPPRSIVWYRSPIDGKTLRSLQERSDWLGLLQAGGFLGTLVLTGTAVFLAAGRLPVIAVILLLLLHGICCSFIPAAVHELTHGTVFRSKALNALFLRVFSFLSWNNFEIFKESHPRHHRSTLHAPDDLEVVLPMKLMAKYLILYGIVSPIGDASFGRGAYNSVASAVQTARRRFSGEWMQILYPESALEKRRQAINWARIMLIGHGIIFAGAIYFKLWLIPILITFNQGYGGGLLLLLNNAQHIGLQDNVPDFRLCCRTVILNPVLRFLYWHMNYHTEHHMYAAVPCYRLGRVHELIKRDLPDCPYGVIATWRQIYGILKQQKEDPTYQYAPPLPQSAANAAR